MRWRDAMAQALYGQAGFFTRTGSGGPASHFRTSATASPLFAAAVARLLALVDAALDHPERVDLVDVGAGRGELLVPVLAALPADALTRVRPTAVELAERPPGLPEMINWSPRLPGTVSGLLIATEWLDNVPLDIAVLANEAETDETHEIGKIGETPRAEAGPRYLLVDKAGNERIGPLVDSAAAEWLAKWWPLVEPGQRAEIGIQRDQAWAEAVATLTSGLAVAVDYGHSLASRPPFGTLTGFREGREVRPIPDGSCDVTAHVAFDSVAAAGERVARQPAILTDQRTALRSLGISGARPPLALASTNPAEYVRGLSAATEAQELTDRAGLGGHHWLAQPVGITPRLPWTEPDV